MILILVPMVPLGVGIWLAWRGLRGGPTFPSCGKCSYDVTGSIGSATRCPECGSPFAEVGIVRPRGRHHSLMTAGGLILVVTAVGCLGTGGISGVMALRAQSAQAQAARINAQAAARSAATKPAVDDAAAPDAAASEVPSPGEDQNGQP